MECMKLLSKIKLLSKEVCGRILCPASVSKKIGSICLGISAGLMLFSCTDDIKLDSGLQGDGETPVSQTMSFFLEAGADFNTRYSLQSDVETYDNYINPNKLTSLWYSGH